jgi:hypothetical protein
LEVDVISVYSNLRTPNVSSIREFIIDSCVGMEEGDVVGTYVFETDEYISILKFENSFIVSSSSDNSFVRQMFVGFLNIEFGSGE